MRAALLTDLLVTEVVLPMPGEQALRMLRSACPNARLLITTSDPWNEALQHWLTQDGVDVLMKPFRLRLLLEKVAEMLDLKRVEE